MGLFTFPSVCIMQLRRNSASLAIVAGIINRVFVINCIGGRSLAIAIDQLNAHMCRLYIIQIQVG